MRVQLQDIEKILGIQGVRVTKTNLIYGENEKVKEVEIWLEPVNSKHNCPCCESAKVVLNGNDGYRRVQHLKMGLIPSILIVPQIRLKCKDCQATFGHTYTFVDGKEQYTIALKAHVYEISIGSTVQHTVAVTGIPYSTVERFFKEAALVIAQYTEEQAQRQAIESEKLILGIDDFSIRKGHKYNTGIHDLRGESFLGIAKGRTLEELDDYMEKNPNIAKLKPYAVVMDLARGYHSFAEKYFPDAIRVADRFHVNKYALEPLDGIRKRISENLPPQACRHLKRKNRLLMKRNDSLTESQRNELEKLLSYSDDLKAAYWFKEQLIDWYDLSPNYTFAQNSYQRWLEHGLALNIPEIHKALKTFISHSDVIVNYHRCRFTNGIVEGRNGKIKSLQRRHFFLSNRTFYEALCIIECNMELARQQFIRLFA
jgi:transposase